MTPCSKSDQWEYVCLLTAVKPAPSSQPDGQHIPQTERWKQTPRVNSKIYTFPPDRVLYHQPRDRLKLSLPIIQQHHMCGTQLP